MKHIALALTLAACSSDGPDPAHEWLCDSNFCQQRACVEGELVLPVTPCAVDFPGVESCPSLDWEGRRGCCLEQAHDPSPSGFGIAFVECIE